MIFKKRIPRELENYAKEVLRDIIPAQDPLSYLREGEKSLEELLRDATFLAQMEEKAGRSITKEELKEILKRLMEK
jgi:hypothetical protein